MVKNDQPSYRIVIYNNIYNIIINNNINSSVWVLF